MKLTIKRRIFPTRTQSLLRGSRYLFFIIGILALAYCGYVLLDAKLYQAYQARRFQEELEDTQSNANREPAGTFPHPRTNRSASTPVGSVAQHAAASDEAAGAAMGGCC